MLNSMTQRAKPFDIPAINNHLEALAVHLGLDSYSISSNGVYNDHYTTHVRLFRCPDNVLYAVAHSCVGLNTTVKVWYNSNHWYILKLDAHTGTKVFSDKVVTDKLATLLGDDKQITNLQQSDETFEVKSESGVIEVWKYRSHHPEDLTSYYLQGLLDTKLTTYHPKNSLNVVLSWDHNFQFTHAHYSDGEEVELSDSLRANFQLDIDTYVRTNN
ncbi:hypothetical protein [Vibrio agarivorans]|uniref:hypothetical protein n=1 Tax=Vibrio agarivorans TaxID=153622 RepID=UPI0025B587A3|nr:hypothetical protein [Vibrio agarivorans]MDN3661118.1 hypothetical protein [Vibrio agarivorans]